MELLEKVKSKLDKTIKYVFKLDDDLIMEVTYIDNNTGKDIICVATQTMCAMACSFCHLTDYIGKLKLRNVTAEELVQSVDYIYDELELEKNDRVLLISYMGCGEPLLNLDHVEHSMRWLMKNYENIRFGLSTMLPKGGWSNLFELAGVVKRNKIPLKIHLSLHYTNDEQRNKHMPNALDIKPAISALEFYKNLTKNSVEIHYTMIKGENDSIGNALVLSRLIEGRGIPVKFLRFNDKDSSDSEKAEMEVLNDFRAFLEGEEIETEYYEPPGISLGASCGMFLFDQYQKI